MINHPTTSTPASDETVLGKHIQHIDAPWSDDAKLAGYDGPGWYFWDETQTICHGPYDTSKIAETNLHAYGVQLNQSPVSDELEETVMDRLMTLYKHISDNENAILLAERLKAQGRWLAEWDSELEERKAELIKLKKEQKLIISIINRMCKKSEEAVA